MKVQNKHDDEFSAVEYDAFTRLDSWLFLRRVFFELTGEHLADNFHIEILCAQFDRIRSGRNVRLAVALPPRSLKSIIFSVALPAWLLGHDPSLEIVCVSYGQELSDKHSADFRRIMLSPWYRRLFPKTKLDRQAIDHLTTTAGGKRYATSVGGTLTGMGADVIIVDDPMKPDEALSDAERTRINQWAQHTLFTRMNDKRNDRIIVAMQRLHEEDMIGRVMELGNFEFLSFPAIALEDEVHLVDTPFSILRYERKEGEALHPEREPLETLEKQRQLLGPENFAAQYLQSPTPPGGGLVKIHQFRRYEPDNKPPFIRFVQSWDCASKASELNDYSVCTTWGVTDDKFMYLLHVFRERLEYPELKRKVRQLAQQHKADIVVIEDTSAGSQLIQELTRERFAKIEPYKSKNDKIMRMREQTSWIEEGKVYLPSQASWLPEYEQELAMFAKSKNDDQVDSTSQALAYMTTKIDFQLFMESFESLTGRKDGVRPEELTVTFKHSRPGTIVRITGREISEGPDGYYHATEDERHSITLSEGITWISPAK
jgi:predicted phage terminase large subunit-like protein